MERAIRLGELTRLTGLGKTTLWALERRGEFPRRRQLVAGGRVVCWLESEVTSWLRAREVGSGPAPVEALRARGFLPPEAA